MSADYPHKNNLKSYLGHIFSISEYNFDQLVSGILSSDPPTLAKVGCVQNLIDPIAIIICKIIF